MSEKESLETIVTAITSKHLPETMRGTHEESELQVAIKKALCDIAQQPIFGYSNVEVEGMMLFALAHGYQTQESVETRH